MQWKFFALLQKYSTAILHRLLTRPTTMQICSCLPSSGKCQNLFWEIKVTEFKQTGQVEVTRDDWNPKFSQIYNSGKASGGRRWPSEASQKDTRDSQHFSHCSRSTILFLASDGILSQRQPSDRLEMVPVCSGCNVSAYWLGQSRSEESRPTGCHKAGLMFQPVQYSPRFQLYSWIWPLWGNILIRNLSSVIK